MSVNTFDVSLWRQHAPADANYGDRAPTRSGSVWMDGCCFVTASVQDVDRAQKDPAAVERVMDRLTSSVKEHTGAAVVRLVDLEAYTLRNGSDALKARFAYSGRSERRDTP